MRRASTIIAVTLVALVWVVALVAAPSAASSPHRYALIASAGVYTAGSLICHQSPERSFHVAGAQLPVCARCLGMYVGGLLGVITWAGLAGVGRQASPRARSLAASSRLRRVLVVVAVPTILSVVVAWLGWWDLANLERALVALPLGAVIGGVVCAVAAGDLR